MQKIERVFFHYEDLEEYRKGMWRIVRGDKRKEYVLAAADLMRDSDKFKASMMRVLNEWPNSVAFNLTNESVNRIAFLGHSGCCIATGSPEEATRCGWHTLNQAEQDEANRVAQEVLDHWEEQYLGDAGVDLFSYMERANA